MGAFKDFNAPPGVVVEMLDVDHQVTAEDTKRYLDLVANTTFSLQLRGHRRWLLRTFGEMCLCAVPVILSDGWDLPYDNIIDWPSASIQLSEELAGNATRLLAQLPKD